MVKKYAKCREVKKVKADGVKAKVAGEYEKRCFFRHKKCMLNARALAFTEKTNSSLK